MVGVVDLNFHVLSEGSNSHLFPGLFIVPNFGLFDLLGGGGGGAPELGLAPPRLGRVDEL